MKTIAKIWILVLIITLSFFALVPKKSFDDLKINSSPILSDLENNTSLEFKSDLQKHTSESINPELKNEKPVISDQLNVFQNASLQIVEKKIELDFIEGESLYDAMLRAKLNQKIDFQGKSFPVLGFFVEEIENLKQGNDKFLFFYVNEIESSVGVSNYKLKEGDHVEWRLK